MKPTKNRIYCNDSGRIKMLFETEKKANLFIKFNSEEIESESGYSPIRVYFCISCNGWHVTSKEDHQDMISKTEYLLNLLTDKGKKKLTEKEREISTEKRKEELNTSIKRLRNIYTKIDYKIKDLEIIMERLNYYSESLVAIYEYVEFMKKIGLSETELLNINLTLTLLGRELRNIGYIGKIKQDKQVIDKQREIDD
jgi:hypothetical protein